MKNLALQSQTTLGSIGSALFRKTKYLLFTFLLSASLFNTANATHYRFGNISWTYVSGRTVTFHVTQAFRRSYASFVPPPVIGSHITTQSSTGGNSFLNFGDGSNAVIDLIVTSINLTEDWIYGEFTIDHTYAADGNYDAFFIDCCRLSTLLNNADQNYRSNTIVTIGAPALGNNSPVSGSPPIVNLVTGLAPATFNLIAFDPDFGDVLSYRLPTSAELGGPGLSNLAGLSINAATGVVSLSTVGKAVGNLYQAAFVVTDNHGASTMIDIILRIVAPSNAPIFDYGPGLTPVDGFEYSVQPGTNINFNVKAHDVDAGDNVALTGTNIPAGATMVPALPTAGNPVQSNFDWTPTIADLGSRVVTFTGTDNFLNQTTTTVKITVSVDPVFDVPPTPMNGEVDACIVPGTLYTRTIQAHTPNPAPAATVSITAASVIPNASYTPTIPTPVGVTTSTVLNFTPVISQWGPKTFSFTATDFFNHTTNHSFDVVVNTKPTFTSSPVLSAVACQQYIYNIKVADPDIPYGDEIDEFGGTVIPAWLTLSWTPGSLVATLKGTPAASDIGPNPVSLFVGDIYHHCPGGGSNQDFVITVSGSPIERLYVDQSIPVSGNGTTWALAIKELRDAIPVANANPCVREIWVADGNYKATATTNRALSMNITRANLRILGGFAGGETDASAANPVANPTIVSGEIGAAGTGDNSYHPLKLTNIPLSAGALEINGFIFENGNANVAGAGNNYGGAILVNTINAGTSVQIKRSVFRQNNASAQGGAMYIDHGSVAFDGCSFTANTSGNIGGAICGFFSSSSFDKTVFEQNSATTSGGAFYCNYGTTTFGKTVFSSNTSKSGGAVYLNQANASIDNSVFSGNSASFQGGAVYQHNASSTTQRNNTYFNNSASNSGGAISLGLNASKTVASNVIFWKNKKAGLATIAKADVDNFGGSVTNEYHNCALQANTTVPADNGTTITANSRGVDPLFTNEASPIGADVAWRTGDDGLQLQNGSPAKDAGLNAGSPGAQDINDNTRIVCVTIDKGAYENQTCGAIVAGPAPQSVSTKATTLVKDDVSGIVANPFSNNLQIRYAGSEKCAMTVYGTSGKTMYISGSIAPGITNVNASSWTRGVYQVVLKTASGKQMTYKVVKL